MNEGVFKTTVMGGFNKSEVLAFIDRQDSQFKERERELTSQINSLNSSLNNEILENNRLKKQITELNDKLNEEKAKSEEALKKLEELSSIADRAENDAAGEIERRDAEINRLAEKLREAENRAAAAESNAVQAEADRDKYADKLALIDKTQEQIGRAMLEAQQTADKIIENAKYEAESEMEKARVAAQELIDKANERVNEINAEAQEKLNALIDDAVIYKKRIDYAREYTTKFFEAIDSMYVTMQANADDVQNSFSTMSNTDTSEETDSTGETDSIGETDCTGETDYTVQSDDTAETGAADESGNENTYSGGENDIYDSEIVRRETAAMNFDFRDKETSD